MDHGPLPPLMNNGGSFHLTCAFSFLIWEHGVEEKFSSFTGGVLKSLILMQRSGIENTYWPQKK